MNARAAAALLALLLAAPAWAGSPRLCDQAAEASAAQQDRLLQVAAVVRRELEASGGSLALVARSGLDLARFGIRYSHAGVSLRASANTPWSVRQLYYACDEGRPRLFDQGLAGFLLGTENPTLGYVSIVLLPPAAAAPLEAAALDNAQALRLLAARYSATAYPFSIRYQNCNQWLVELLAGAWGALPEGGNARERAQDWLRASGYEPGTVDLGSRLLMFASGFVPFVHVDDQPEDERFALRYRLSLPTSIEAFVHDRLPGARRVEICHDGQQVVIHRGWSAVAEGCRPGAGDEVVALDR